MVMVVVSTAESYFTTSTVTAAFTWKLHPIAGKAVEGGGFGGGAGCECRGDSGGNGRCLVRRGCLPVATAASDENCIRGRRKISRENTICCKGHHFGGGGGGEGRGA